MKYLSRLLAGALLVSLTACSSDEPAAPGGEVAPEPAEPFYSTISFKMPESRSGAENEGEEVGKDYENNVGSILVILATKENENAEYKYLTCALNNAPVASNKTSYTITFQNKTKLFAQAGKDVYVFAYCNPTDALRTAVLGTLNPTTGNYEGGLENPKEGTTPSTSFTDLICGTTEGDGADVTATWRKNAFLMTSVAIHKVTLPDEETLKTYNNDKHAFDLCQGTDGAKPIEVIRTASRFDIKDASANNDWTYEIEDPKSETTPKAIMGKVKLTRVAMFNMRKEFFYLPRVYTTDPDTKTLCPGMLGMEFGVSGGTVTSEVFVVSPEGRAYDLNNPASIDPNQELTTGTDIAGLQWTELTSLSEEDNDTSWNEKTEGEGESATTTTKDPNRKGYKIWRYTSENTFPKATETAIKPTNDNITGVVFEAEIIVNEGFENVKEGKYLTMYLYDGILYDNSLKMYEAIQHNPSSTLSQAFESCFNVTKDDTGKVTAAEPKEGIDLNNFGFTAYKPNKDNKYLCYYWYYNRHVDDNTPSEVGPMEFGTVRNNIYKLSVQNIKKFGKFNSPKFDEWDVYFTLNVALKKWVVRVNDGIEF